jgi:hypothetical protein
MPSMQYTKQDWRKSQFLGLGCTADGGDNFLKGLHNPESDQGSLKQSDTFSRGTCTGMYLLILTITSSVILILVISIIISFRLATGCKIIVS